MQTIKVHVNTEKLCIIFLIPTILCTAFYSFTVQMFTGYFFYLILLLSFMVFRGTRLKKAARLDTRNASIVYGIWFVLFFVTYFFFNPSNSLKVFFGLQIHVEIICAAQILLLLPVARNLQHNSKYDRIVVWLLIASFLINAFFTVRAVNANFNISKVMATGGVEEGLGSEAFGVIGYAVVYALVLFIPALITGVAKAKGRNRIAMLILLIAGVYLVLKTGYFTAILIICMEVLLLIFMNSSKNARYLCLPLAALLLVIIFNNNIIAEALDYVASLNLNPNITRRANEAAMYMMGGEQGSSLIRLTMFESDIAYFLSSPIFGVAVIDPSMNLSEHSNILNMLAAGGIVLLTPFLLFLRYEWRSIRRECHTKYARNIITVSFISYLVLGTINTILRSSAATFSLIVVLPCITRVVEGLIEKGDVKDVKPNL